MSSRNGLENGTSNVKSFGTLFDTFITKIDDLCLEESRAKEVEKVITPLKTNPRDPSGLIDSLKGFVEEGARCLPGQYRMGFSNPLLQNINSLQKWSAGTVETLAGAVYDHVYNNYTEELRCLLAFTSNVYRSFMEPERLPLANFPQPAAKVPALVTFNPKPRLPGRGKLWKKDDIFTPFILPVPEVQRLCGASVSVVSLPSVYRRHPLFCWGSIAHEVGGHDILHGYPGLLTELRRGVRELFYQGPDPHQYTLDNQAQKLGLLWQYWAEETACDVFAVMNVGPTYGVTLAIYFAALSERIRRHFQGSKDRDRLPALPISNVYNRELDITNINYHPTNILALYAVIGAIEALRDLNGATKKRYVDDINSYVDFCLMEGNEQVLTRYKKSDVSVDHYSVDKVNIKGFFRVKSGCWVWLGEQEGFMPDNRLIVPLDEMKRYARRVGHYIASAKFQAFNGHSIQDLETWDDYDEAKAEGIKNQIPFSRDNLQFLADDAQLFAGCLLALRDDPSAKNYDSVNELLIKMLGVSFETDDVWGTPNWHPMAGPTL